MPSEDYYLVVQTIIEPEDWDEKLRTGSSDYNKFNYVFNPT
jgi:hypothetical protein